MTVTGPKVWTAASLPVAAYEVHLDDATMEAYRSLRDHLVAAGRTLDTVTASDFSGTVVEVLAAAVEARVVHGCGIAVLKGLCIDDWPDEDAAMMWWGLGTALGTPLPQNRAGDRVYLVQNTEPTATDGERQVRGSKTNGRLIFHTDAASGFRGSWPQIIGLHCLRPAAEGGDSLVVSAYEVLNRFADRHPDLLDRLAEPFVWDISAEADPGEQPWSEHPMLFPDFDPPRMRVNAAWIAKGYPRAGRTIDDAGDAAMRAFDRITRDDDLAVRFSLDDGDMVVIDNNAVMHDRTAFTDDPARPRCLVRLWIDR